MTGSHAMTPSPPEGASSISETGDRRIARAWERCRQAGLDPSDQTRPRIADGEELRHRQQAMAGVLRATRIELASLVRHIAGSGHILLVTDAQGVILNYFGDRQFNEAARHHGLVLGACWSEQAMATQAIGLSLVEQVALQLGGDQHYRRDLRGLSGSSVPLFQPDGTLAGGLHAVASCELANPHTLALLRLTAEAVEKRVLLGQRASRQRVLRFHSRPEFVDAPGEGLLLVGVNDRIAGATSSACFHLGIPVIAELVDHTVAETFNISSDSLPEGDHQVTPAAVYETRAGRRFYASLLGIGQGRESGPVRRTRGPVQAAGDSPVSSLRDLELGDPTMAENIRRASRVLDHELPILIYGETGTGKEVFSKALHQASSRHDQNYVAVNCASIPETLIESELFGYKGGAFTGASREGNRGKIVQADGGTLFLDEIGDMPFALQGRLLRVLEEREVIPLGSNTPVKVDIRLVSATHRDLQAMIAEGEFREDLYYRLQGVSITLPPLRERTDRRPLIQRLLQLENQGQPVNIEQAALDAMDRYDWPGNIRQLCNVLRIALALRDGDSIRYADLPTEIRTAGQAPRHGGIDQARVEQQSSAIETNPLESAEREVLLAALERYYWNITNIARRFKVSRNTIYRKMKAHNIRPPRGR
ncbi:sigma-54-dependent Fis family transcriptional regulator [Methylonatrum kenyense]|uniref:sigma-54-dependent Fis family transcriptional regulator n=1 Tax=Methylonatrum kenyense TaxID=455253 RepID=UPI0020C13EAF|nr:sigma-54-dependent Fis family transcriptional regulator [Methylonatrum kenyense]MCK8517348.1 sigma-54-dependent Fis family transcriptional regulator [Methylonatrum kenyense]